MLNVMVINHGWDMSRCYGCDKDMTSAEDYIEFTSIYNGAFKLCPDCDKKMRGFCPGGIRKHISKVKPHKDIITKPFRWKIIHKA